MLKMTKNFYFFIAIIATASAVPVIDQQNDNLQWNSEKLKDPYMVDLAERPECSMDVERICGKALMKTNFDVINCLQTSFRDYDISDKCQNLIWNYKKNITTDPKYEQAVKSICGNMIQKLPECQNLDHTKGHLISCLVEHIQDPSLQPLALHCDSFLKRLEPVVFSDYRIVYKFTEACQNDIDRLHCGRVHEATANQAPYHNQGMVLDCLSAKLQDLHDTCKFELLRVAELQGQDYHFDRQLFFSCRNDREKFCKDVQSGEGRVYRCLINNKLHPEMSEKCKEKLLNRQVLEQEDYKVNVKLAIACSEDIKKNDCDKEVSTVAGFVRAKMSAIVLCLESVEHEGGNVKGECRAEMKDVRRGLMEDYRVSPQLVASCSHEIKDRCGGDLKTDGSTIHCLMELAKPKQEDKSFHSFLSKPCEEALHDLLLVADAVSDYEVDPYWHHSCMGVVRAYCSEEDDDGIYDCLFDSIDKPLMTEACRSSLYQLEYFKNRDFRLDPDLYKECHKDAQEICQAPAEWHIKGKQDDENIHIISCLYRHSWKTSDDPKYKPISRECASQVRRVMRERAISVNLRPEVEEACLVDLSKHCLDKTEKEQEMDCLEDNWESLSEGCQKAVGEYIEEVDKDPEMSDVFLRWCKPVWEQRCTHVVSQLSLEHIDEQAGYDLMECLIENKHHPSMTPQCKAGVEHHQLITLKNVKFSHKMNTACHTDIQNFCHGESDKSLVVICLNEVRLNDTLLGKPPRLNDLCVQELDEALSERSENIKLDPVLEKACGKDMQELCQHVPQDMGQMHECLEVNIKRLSKDCQTEMFKRVQSEALDPKTDYYLFSHCELMITEFCAEYDDSPAMLFNCLYKSKSEPKFDEKCRNIVISRAHLFGMDFRLNNELQLACKDDVHLHCKEELRYSQEEGKHEGLVIECLKTVYAHKLKDEGGLSEGCSSHVRDLIAISSEDFLVDFALAKMCNNEIQTHCSDVQTSDQNYSPLDTSHHQYKEDRGKVLECLQKKLSEGSISEHGNPKCHKQLKRIMQESLVDIHADSRLHRACSSDLLKFCEDTVSGDGKQLECLLVVLQDKRLKNHMNQKCKELLNDRIALWNKAMPEADLPHNLQQVVDMISSSPSSNYLFLLIAVLIIVIFVMGLCLGRLTKRLQREMKLR